MNKYFEYTSAVNPAMPQIQAVAMKAEKGCITQAVAIDLSAHLGTSYRATAPNCLVHFVTILKDEVIELKANATSNVFVVVKGKGVMHSCFDDIAWKKHDVMAMPYTKKFTFSAEEDAILYWVSDEPLLSYLNVTPSLPAFEPCVYPFNEIQQAAEQVNHNESAAKRNRNGVLLANPACTLTKTITPTLWALFNVINPGEVQPPHRHQSVALDLCLSASEGVYTMMSQRLDENEQMVNPVRMDWTPGGAFITPPGWWHAHYNESGEEAVVLPVQDAGLQMYMRTLDIQFKQVNQWRHR